MSVDMLITLGTLATSIVLLVSNALRADLVAVGIILCLMFTGVVSVEESLSGFASPVVMIIACMFIVGKAIIHTGLAREVGNYIIRRGGKNETHLMLLLMAASAGVGSFMSSTATAAIFIPITLSVAEKAGLNHRRLLMPLGMASLISGMMTLVATSPNIVLNSALLEQGFEGLPFFGFTPFGVCVLLMAMGFMALVGRNLLAPGETAPARKRAPSIDDLLRYHNIAQKEFFYRVPPTSNLAGRSVAAMQLSQRYGITLLAVRSLRNGRPEIEPARPEWVFEAEDLLLCIAESENAQDFATEFSLQPIALSRQLKRSFFQVVGIAEVMLNPDSTLIGKSLRESGFQHMFHSMVLGIRRKGETLTEDIASLPLSFGDVLLLCGAWADILQLGRYKDKYLLLTLPNDKADFAPAQAKQPLALAVLAAMVVVMALGVLPAVTAILAAAVVLVLTRCVPVTSVYDVIDWPTIVLIAGMIPLALALQKTGIIDEVGNVFMSLVSGVGPIGILAGLYFITTALGCVMSNTPVAVLLAPMVLHVSQVSGVSPQACIMVVAIACSAAFVSPFGSPVLLLVREPGEYNPRDYLKTGIPLMLCTLPITLALVWLLYL